MNSRPSAGKAAIFLLAKRNGLCYNAFVALESCPSGRRCSTRNHLDQMEGSCPVTLDFPNLFSNPGFMHSLFALQFALQL